MDEVVGVVVNSVLVARRDRSVKIMTNELDVMISNLWFVDIENDDLKQHNQNNAHLEAGRKIWAGYWETLLTWQFGTDLATSMTQCIPPAPHSRILSSPGPGENRGIIRPIVRRKMACCDSSLSISSYNKD